MSNDKSTALVHLPAIPEGQRVAFSSDLLLSVPDATGRSPGAATKDPGAVRWFEKRAATGAVRLRDSLPDEESGFGASRRRVVSLEPTAGNGGGKSYSGFVAVTAP